HPGANMRVTDLLRTMDIFSALPSEKLETIAHLLRERRLAESEVLCRQGEPGDAMFIVTGGRIRLSTIGPSGNEKVLTYFTDGQFFGETALLTDAPRSATATAETDSQLLVLDKAAFDRLIANHAQSMREILKVVSRRTLQTNQQLLAEEGGNAVSVGAGGVYAIFSPRGGSGKTTLAVNLAVQQALEQPERTALVDLSLTFGHTAALLGLEPEVSLAAVPAETLADFDRRTLGAYLIEHTSGLHLLVAGTRPEEGEVVTAAHVRAALGAMKRQFTATFVDCGSSFDEPIIAALELADRIIVICTPELNTLRDVRECQRVFGEIIRLDLTRVCFVFNHNQPFAVLSREQFESALEESMLVEVPHAGEAAYKAASRGEPLVSSNAGSVYARAIEKLVHLLAPVEAKVPQKRGLSVLGRSISRAPASASHTRRAG
ncbi:MAG: cyclic nucleotide-binding domain-containing protein, partial [Chloroflexota bacterium]|nr:cyclic nucleotide-binding domain-containing protein [Chloroflexota bacterium]